MQGIRLFVAALAALVIGTTGIALAQGDSDPEGSATAAQLSEPPVEDGVELSGKRTATSDTYLLPNGARETRLYESPVNYRDSEGNWQPIDEGLEDLAGGGLANGPNRFDLRLPEKIGAGPTRISLDGEWVSAELAGPETEEAQVQGNTAVYEFSDGGTSFELASLANGVKEDIEIADASQPASFVFELDASDGLTPRMAPDGSIEFRNADDQPVVVLPAPVISDSAPGAAASTEAVHYSLSSQSASHWRLTVEADQAWLQAPDRQFPVQIDPTLIVSSPSLDCEIRNNGTDQNYCGLEGYKQGGAKATYFSTGSDKYSRSLYQFGLSSIPANAWISKAIVGLHAPSAAQNTAGAELLRVRKTWTKVANWSRYSSGHLWENEGGDTSANGGENPKWEGGKILTAERGSQAGWWNFDIAEVTEKWAHGEYPNQGLLLLLTDERAHECPAGVCTTRLLEVDSSAASEASFRPRMEVTYYQPASADSKVTSPQDGTRSAKRFKLKAAWTHAGVTGVQFQYQTGSRWANIPTSKVTDKNNQTVQWPLAIEGGAHESQAVYWNASGALSSSPIQDLKIRALLIGTLGGEGYTTPVSVQLNEKTGGTKDATTAVGPGTLDLLTGNFTVSRTDVSIPGFGSSLTFTRTFSSRSPSVGSGEKGDVEKTGPLGEGWEPGVPVEAAGGAEWRSVRDFQPSAEEAAEGMPEYALLTDLEGYEYAFEYNGSAFVTPPEASGWVLSREGANFVLTDPGANRTTFSNGSGGSEYLPVSVTQTGGPGNKTQMIYELVNKKRRLSMAIAPAAPGVSCNSESEAMANLGCHSLKFTYKPATTWGGSTELGDRLASITYYGPASASSMGNWKVATYAYNAKGRMIEEWDPRISDTVRETYGYEESGPLRTITPPGEEPWTFEYGTFDEEKPSGRLIAVKRPSLLASPSVAQTTIAYGVPLTGASAPYGMSGAAVGEWGQQDLPADATAIFPPDQVPSSPPSSYSRATINYMDAEGQLVNTATPSGAGTSAPSITTAETDEHGNVVRELSAQNRLRALAQSSESGKIAKSHELETKRTYNADGTELQEEWGPLHQVRLESGAVVQARLHTTTEYEDAKNGWPGTGVNPHLPTRQTTGASIPGQGTDADQRVTETSYNWTLRQATDTIVDPGVGHLSLRTHVEYDTESGLPTERRLPANPSGGDAHTTKIVYYTAGANSQDSSCGSKPAWANLPCKTMPAAQPGTAGQPELLVTKYLAYNQLGEPTEVSESPGGGASNVRKTIATYDSAGRKLTSKQEGGGTAIPKVETLYSSTMGMPTTQRFVCEVSCSGFDTQATTTTYDKLGRPTAYEDADGNLSSVSYDLLGRPVTTSDGKGIQTRTYDPTSGLLVKLEDSGAGTFTAAYDADGNMVEEGLPNGLLEKTSYDEAGQPTHLTYEKKTFCSLNCTWLDFNAERSIYGQVLSQTNLVSSQQYTYDKAGRLTVVRDTPQGGGCTTRSYSFDADSNRTALVTRAPGIGGACDLASEGAKQTYSYDAGDRLTTPTGIAYDNYSRITSLPAADAGGSTLTSTYYSNDLIRSQTQGGVTNTYELDAALRQRARTQTGGSEPGTEIYHYAGGSDSAAWIDRGSSWSRSIVGIDGGLCAIQDSAKGKTLQLTNLHGDIVATASPNAEATKPLASFEFDEFGNPKLGSAVKYGWLGSKGRRTELPSGVIQMGVRSYVPAMGRFVSVDPVPGGSATAYDYANQNPVNQFDLSGCYPLGSRAEFECIGHCAKSHCGGHNFAKVQDCLARFHSTRTLGTCLAKFCDVIPFFKCAKDCVGKNPPPPPPPRSNAPHRVKPWWEYPIPLPVLG